MREQSPLGAVVIGAGVEGSGLYGLLLFHAVEDLGVELGKAGWHQEPEADE